MIRRIATALTLALLLTAGFVAGRASADQPHMQAAMDHLRLAKQSLERASEDKGGHRSAAIRLVNDAMHQVEEGIRFDRRH
jgi:hypothetical protein